MDAEEAKLKKEAEDQAAVAAAQQRTADKLAELRKFDA
jgi:hypothetical protein